MLTKAKKKEHVELSSKKIKASKNIVFVDFTKIATPDINALKAELRKVGGEYKVMKKRLLKIALKEAGIEFDPSTTKAPIATVYTPTDLTAVASPIYKFLKDLAKRKIDFKVLGAYDAEAKKMLSAAEFTVIAKLPNRETLLAMVLGAMTGPLRAFMYIASELSKRTSASSVQVAPAAPAAVAAPAPAAPAAPTPATPTDNPAPAA